MRFAQLHPWAARIALAAAGIGAIAGLGFLGHTARKRWWVTKPKGAAGTPVGAPAASTTDDPVGTPAGTPVETPEVPGEPPVTAKKDNGTPAAQATDSSAIAATDVEEPATQQGGTPLTVDKSKIPPPPPPPPPPPSGGSAAPPPPPPPPPSGGSQTTKPKSRVGTKQADLLAELKKGQAGLKKATGAEEGKRRPERTKSASDFSLSDSVRLFVDLVITELAVIMDGEDDAFGTLEARRERLAVIQEAIVSTSANFDELFSFDKKEMAGMTARRSLMSKLKMSLSSAQTPLDEDDALETENLIRSNSLMGKIWDSVKPK